MSGMTIDLYVEAPLMISGHACFGHSFPFTSALLSRISFNR